MRLPARVAFVSTTLKDAFDWLRNSDKMGRKRFASLSRAFERLTVNAFCGIQIPKRLIPDAYLRKHNARNLWKLNLHDGWRLLYCVENQTQGVTCIVIDWLDHKEYERLFNY
jgi:mRNA-degrading endonuclease RelE of RelBE toxin-antitoxin system